MADSGPITTDGLCDPRFRFAGAAKQRRTALLRYGREQVTKTGTDLPVVT
jgi:hypothetical protein